MAKVFEAVGFKDKEGMMNGKKLETKKSDGSYSDQRCYGKMKECNSDCPAYSCFTVPDKLKEKFEKAFPNGMAQNIDSVQKEFPGVVLQKKGKPPKPKPGTTVWLRLCTGALIQIS